MKFAIYKGIGTSDGDKYAAKITDGGVLRQYIDSVYDNYEYDFSFDAKALVANDQNSFTRINFLNGGDESLKEEKVVITNVGEFQKYTKTVKAPKGTEKLRVEVRTSDGNAVIIDNVKLEQK